MSQRTGRAVFGVNAAVSLALVVVVAGVALVVNPPAPPGIAAFAPQASKPITKAPLGQSSSSGQGSGACAATQSCVGPSPTPSPTMSLKPGQTPPPSAGPSASSQPVVADGVPSALQCYTWPDGSVTQTFDPQSPPCVATWPGAKKGNGGATATGVTSTEIRVAYPQAKSGSTLDSLKPLADFFNTHFELYGRKIVLVPYDSTQATSYYSGIITPDPSLQHADAEAAAADKVFAATDFNDVDNGVTLAEYIDTLNSKGVVSVVGGSTAPLTTAAQLAKEGQEWTYSPTIDQVFDATAGLVCRQLAGKRAVHSGGYMNKVRTWAILLPDQGSTGGALPGLSALQNTLSGCGITAKTIYYDTTDKVGSKNTPIMTQLKADGITSLLTIPWYGAGTPGQPQHVADSIGYNPEWVDMGFEAWITGSVVEIPSKQYAHTFGVGAWNKLSELSSTPWAEAMLAAGGSDNGADQGADGLYEELLMLASGIQEAGPHLTPATFAAAMHGTDFPNPGAAAAPSYQATVGFQEGQTMVNDYNGFWLDPTAGTGDFAADENTLNDYQMFCYVGLGRRATATTWPSSDAFLQGTCR